MGHALPLWSEGCGLRDYKDGFKSTPGCATKAKSHRGGWCLSCIFFLNQSERASLGVFVKTPFVKYNKSKEICRKHAQTDYHSRAVTRAYHFRTNYSNPEQRIDSRLSDMHINARNFRLNSEALPAIVEAVIMCAMQRIALQGHQQDKIDFGSAPLHNEGNFIAIVRLLARNNLCLNEHLTSGPRNAKYTSKTIQNEILEIAADQIREFYRTCLKKCPHFAVMADEVTSHGKEILSVCLRLLEIDNVNFQVKPKKHELLLDFSFLQRITGQSIAQSILSVLEKHGIDIKSCRG